MDKRTIGEAMDGASGGSARRSDGWYERWFSLKERWMIIGEAMDGASGGSESYRKSDG